jgi:hypothetical protein
MKRAKPVLMKTTLIRVNKKSGSLKTTVPKRLIDSYDLKNGGTITWIYTAQNDSIAIDFPNSNGNERVGGEGL